MHDFRNNPFFFLQILLHLRKGIPQGATPGPFYSLRHKQHISTPGILLSFYNHMSSCLQTSTVFPSQTSTLEVLFSLPKTLFLL